MSLLILSVSGCKTTKIISDYCDISSEMDYTEEELICWSDKHIREVDNHNQRYKNQCAKNKWWKFWDRV